MADVVLDANVVVGLFDRSDALHVAATQLIGRITANGDTAVLLDFCVAEALSVLCRRARERKASPPDLSLIFGEVRNSMMQARSNLCRSLEHPSVLCST